MRKLIPLVIFRAVAAAAEMSAAYAADIDAAWIKKCVSDNKRECASPEVVTAGRPSPRLAPMAT